MFVLRSHDAIHIAVCHRRHRDHRGPPNGANITEVAAILHDGNREIDRWVHLIHPEASIPPGITRLTGIDDSMVADAPHLQNALRTCSNSWPMRFLWRTMWGLTCAIYKPPSRPMVLHLQPPPLVHGSDVAEVDQRTTALQPWCPLCLFSASKMKPTTGHGAMPQRRPYCFPSSSRTTPRIS